MERKYWVHENTGGRTLLYTYCKGHMTKTWWVSEKEGKPKGKQERGKLSFGPCLRRYLIL